MKALSEGSSALVWAVGCGADEDAWAETQTSKWEDKEKLMIHSKRVTADRFIHQGYTQGIRLRLGRSPAAG